MDDSRKAEYARLYVASLNEKQLKALRIAQDHLGDIRDGGTYNMFKTNGFLAWRKKYESEIDASTSAK